MVRHPPDRERAGSSRLMEPFPGIQVVTFDAGSTLIEPWPSVGHIYSQVAARHGIVDLSPEFLNRRFAAAWRAFPQPLHRAADWARLVDEVFAGLTPVAPSQTFFPELYDRFTRPDAWRIYDDVEPALSSLAARGLRLGVISNWDERLRPLLQVLNLARHFETIIVSCEVGVTKPAPEIFREAVGRFGVPPGAMLHVGDSLEADAQGARAAGFRAVRIVRGSPPSDGTLRSLRELPSLVRPQILG